MTWYGAAEQQQPRLEVEGLSSIFTAAIGVEMPAGQLQPRPEFGRLLWFDKIGMKESETRGCRPDGLL